MTEDTQVPPQESRGAAGRNGRGLSWQDMDRLRVDDKGQLLWDGRIVEVSKSFSLTKLQVAYAIASLVVALAGVTAAAVSAWADWEMVRIERGRIGEPPATQ